MQLVATTKASTALTDDIRASATALEFDKAIIATGDPTDIRRLAARHRSLSVFAI